jgi:hypothetical protein
MKLIPHGSDIWCGTVMHSPTLMINCIRPHLLFIADSHMIINITVIIETQYYCWNSSCYAITGLTQIGPLANQLRTCESNFPIDYDGYKLATEGSQLLDMYQGRLCAVPDVRLDAGAAVCKYKAQQTVLH